MQTASAITRKPHHSSRVVVVSKDPADYFSFRFGLTFKGYRNFSIAYTPAELAQQLADGLPELVLVSTAFATEEQQAIVDTVRRFDPDYDRFHLVDAPEVSLAALDAEPMRVRGPAIRNYDNIPINVEIELTSRCNARCVFCPIDKMARVDQTMSEARLAAILDTCRSLQPSLIYLCGVGEPLLYRGRGAFRDIVDVVAAITREIGCPVGVNTNGQLLTPELYRRLLDAGISMVNISINGASQAVHEAHMKYMSHAQVTDNIEQAVRIRPEPISLQGVITKGNHHEIPELVRYWTERGVRIFTFNECSNKSGFLDDHASLWFDDLPSLYARLAERAPDSWVAINSCNFPVLQDEFLCRVPVNFISVDVAGNILHCMHDFASVTEYGKFDDYDAAGLRELMKRRIGSRASICEGCNAPNHDVNQLFWRGHKVSDRNHFAGVAAWELALEQLGPRSARTPAAPSAA